MECKADCKAIPIVQAGRAAAHSADAPTRATRSSEVFIDGILVIGDRPRSRTKNFNGTHPSQIRIPRIFQGVSDGIGTS